MIDFFDKMLYYSFRQQNRAVPNGYSQYPLRPSQRVFAVSTAMFYSSLSCMNMITKLTETVKSLANPLGSFFYTNDGFYIIRSIIYFTESS